jgi:predicted DNA-binding transcriptional regulator YafY
LRQGFRTFRLDRLEGLTVTGEPFHSVPGQTLADFLALMAAEDREARNVQSRKRG